MGENRLKVVGIASDNMGCGHYRLINPIRAMADLGVDAQHTMKLNELVQMAEDADAVILQRVTFPAVLPLIEQWKRTKVVIYELDDLIHEIPPANPAFSQYKHGSDILTNSTRIIRACDGMIASTQELWRYYQRFNRNVVVVPNFIDFRLRDWSTPFPKGKRLVVGWSGGSQHQTETQFLNRMMKHVLSSYSDVDFALYCHPHFAQLVLDDQIPMERVILLPVRTFADYPYQLGAFDVGLAPLENSQFNRAKCLDRDTVVWTPKGWTTVGALKVGDWVWNGERYVHVLATQYEGGAIGVRVYLECGLYIDMTTDHRVLTSMGWLNAGKLRAGDMIMVAPPPPPAGEKRYTVDELCSLFHAAWRRRSNAPRPIRELFRGCSVYDINEFLERFFAGRERYLSDDELRQTVAELALTAGRTCHLKLPRRSASLSLSDKPTPRYSKVVRVTSRWVDAVDIQVEGELFCAHGIVSHNSSLKPLEYMARSVVPVASNIAEYRLLHLQGAPLLLADRDDEWYQAIDLALQHAREGRGPLCRLWVQEHYDLHQNAHRYLDAIEQIRRWKLAGRVGPGEQVKLERHHSCPCGSGRKYARCCYPSFGA